VFSANAKFFDEGTEVEIGVLQPFIDLFFVSARRRTAESELESTKARIAGEIVHVAYDVRRAFVGVRAAQELRDADRDALRAAQASYDLMRELHRAGNVMDTLFTAEEVALGRAKLAAARSEAELVEAREPLNVLLGLWGDAVGWTLAPADDESASRTLDIEHAESRAVEASFDLARGRARASVEARRAGLASLESAFSTGDLGLVAKRESVDGEWGLGPAVVFDLPIFDGGGTAKAVATGRLRAALAEHVALAVEIRAAARTLRERTLALEAEAAFFGAELVPASQRLVEDTLRNYNAMQIGVFDVLVVKEREIAARRDHVERARDARLARIDLEELLAGHLNRERVAALPARTLPAASSPTTGGH
jgi:cobalt-zinc-cadmium efflux system outer membrane protein